MIYDLFEMENNESVETAAPPSTKASSCWFSSIAARLLFALLLIADLSWLAVGVILWVVGAVGKVITFGRLSVFVKLIERMQLTIKRGAVCGVSLLMAFFSPAFGIMIACTYFLMYDPKGIEEVVPKSLQAQFKEYFQKS